MLDRAALCVFLSAGLIAAPALAASEHGQHDHGHAAHAADVSGPGEASPLPRLVVVLAEDTAFREKTIRVKVGETVWFIVKNRGAIPHEFTIASPEEHARHRAKMRETPYMAQPHQNTVVVPPGETRDLVWRFGDEKDLEFACDIPGHAEQGMVGRFVVE